jgi:uncharacterized protein (TIGR02118 family)
VAMKVLLTVGFDAHAGKSAEAILGELRGLVDRGGAARAALDVKATGEELEIVKMLDSDPDIAAMVSLWEPASVAEALALTLPAGARVIGAYRVDEVVQRDYERTWGAGDVSPGVKCVCLVRRKPGMSHDAYSEHWRLRHGPLALELQPGFWHYVQNHIVENLTDDTQPVDGIGELHFRAAEGVESGMFVSEEAATLIMEDTERFMDNATSTTVPTKEHLIP